MNKFIPAILNICCRADQVFKFKIGNLNISTPYFQAVAILFLIFLFILLMAYVRRHYLNWSLKGFWFGIFIGFLLALILEGFLIISGRTVLIQLMGWKNPPQVLQNFLEAGKGELINVLGSSTQNCKIETEAKPQEVINAFQSLDPSQAKKVQQKICNP